MCKAYPFETAIPEAARALVTALKSQGHDACFVGGCVRDIVAGRSPSDFDIATAALPEEVEAVFSDRHCLSVGRAFGTVIVPYGGGHAEVTTYREESGYTDGRHPDTVRFSTVLEKDLARRDFTVNAMAWRPSGGLVDPYDGRGDLARGILRTVGDPKKRLGEDALRILRGVRFATRFRLAPDSAFLAAAKQTAPQLARLSAERVCCELTQMLTGPAPADAIRLLAQTGALKEILPEIAAMEDFDQETPFHHLDLLAHTLCVTERVPADPVLRWAALLHDAGKPGTKFYDDNGTARYFGHDRGSEALARTVLGRLRAPKRQIEAVEQLVRHHMANTNRYTKKSVKKLLRRMDPARLEQLFLLQEADCACASNQGAGNVTEGRELLREILTAKEPFHERQLAVSGHDLLTLGIPEGPEIGYWLKEALSWVEEDPARNQKQILLKQIQDKRRE